MMSFLDRFKEQASAVRGAAGGVAQNAVKQSKSLAAMARIRMAIASEENKAKDGYTELGRLYFRDYEAGTEPVAEDYQPWLDQITDAKAQIERLNEELAQVRAQGDAPAEEPEASDEEPVEAPEAPVENALEQEIVIEVVDEVSEEPPVEPPEETPAETPEEPPVGTLYVDETGAE